MLHYKTFLFILFTFLFTTMSISQDLQTYYQYTNFDKYKAANEKLEAPSADQNRVVFMGNSITEAWVNYRPDFFEKSGYIGRGISGQTTPQMILRFRKDVINLQPKAVVILAGINDIAENSGFTPLELIAENIMTMADMASQHNIKVIICSVTPAIDFPWKPGLNPAEKIKNLNVILKKYARKNKFQFVNYHRAMKDKNDGLKVPEFTSATDLVHPNEAGYIVMEKLVQAAIDKTLK